MKKEFSIVCLLLFFFSCTTENINQSEKNDRLQNAKKEDLNKKGDLFPSDFQTDTIIEDIDFATGGFDDKLYYELLIETHLCNPDFDASANDSSTPCSARLFNFFPYNHNKKLENAFLLQVKAGVNQYPYRRLLIFDREDGELVLMNGVVGYLVKRISRPNKIDDLIVAIVDNLGNSVFDRYDVLLRYENGKYQFVEAVGDLQGEFDSPDLQRRASEAISKRIQEKKLIF